MSRVNRFSTVKPTCCAVCRRRATWVGYAPKPQHEPIIWLCDHAGCHRGARRIYAMPTSTLDAFEIGAALEAAAGAGAYLEKLGTTDLALLSDSEWREFLRLMFTNYEQVLRRKILGDEPPF
jgi:hypothetical protein